MSAKPMTQEQARTVSAYARDLFIMRALGAVAFVIGVVATIGGY